MKKKTLILLVALGIGIVVAFFAVKLISNKNFEKNTKSAVENMILVTYIAESATDSYSDVWGRFIKNGFLWINGERKYFSNFSEAVHYAVNTFEEGGVLNQMDSMFSVSKNYIKKIDGSWFGNRGAKRCIKELYLNVSEYCSLAHSPTGSLQSFNNKTNELSALISKNMKELELYVQK